MAQYILPLPQTDGQSFSIRFELSGVEYRFDFDFNIRTDTWTWGLYDAGGSPISLGLSCELDYDPLAFVSDFRLPPGLLLFTTGTTDAAPAGRNDLGLRVLFVYDDLIND